LIGGLTAGGAVLFGSFGVWLIYRRHRGKRSLFNKKKIKTKEKQPESMDDLRKEMRKKAEEDKVYE
jgi:ABC-type nickel/cobalt efflux system permease component RcnA